jgi:hypothetical protein
MIPAWAWALLMFTVFYREPVIVQRYLPDVRKGDKRILLVDGEFAGAINRVPVEGEARSNMHVGGRAEATELTAREEFICPGEFERAPRNFHVHHSQLGCVAPLSYSGVA